MRSRYVPSFEGFGKGIFVQVTIDKQGIRPASPIVLVVYLVKLDQKKVAVDEKLEYFVESWEVRIDF